MIWHFGAGGMVSQPLIYRRSGSYGFKATLHRLEEGARLGTIQYTMIEG